MAQVVVTGTAFSDDSRILYRWTRDAGHITAAKYDGKFKELLDRLAEYPGIGAPRPKPRPKPGRSIRIGIVYPYLIVYRVSDNADTVTVIRILDGRRKITRKLISPP